MHFKIFRLRTSYSLLFFLISFSSLSQSDSLLIDIDQTHYVRSFEGTRVINGQSVETLYKKDLQVMISHRFGAVSGGIHTFYGLDQANVRIGLDYALSDRMMIGVGRSSQKETYDGYLKFRLLRQSKGTKNVPVSITLFASSTVMTFHKGPLDSIDNLSSRLTFIYQALVAKTIGKLSVQLSPTLLYRNQIESYKDQYYNLSLGFAGRYRLTKRFSITGEYFYVLPGYIADTYYNSASIGVDIQTGGHVFQFHLSNSQGMIEQFFIAKTSDNWWKKGIRLGFTITRVFSLKGRKYQNW